MNHKTFSFSLGCLNPVVAWFNAFNHVVDHRAVADHIRMIACAIVREHFGASIALEVLVDALEAWWAAAGDCTADPAKVDTCWDHLVEQLAVVAGSPWCVGLKFWQRSNDPYEDWASYESCDPDAYVGAITVKPFNLKRLRENPLDHKSRRGLRRVIFDLCCAETELSIEFN